jgi:uncharacterized membrane protein YfcA
MSVDPSTQPPTGPSAHPPDLVGVALGSIAAGGAGAAATVAVGLLVLRDQLERVLPLLLFAGIVVALSTAWTLARPIADWWRRGVTAALAVFAGMMLAALTAPADMVAGQPGLIAFAILAAAGVFAARRYVQRSRLRGW